MQVSPNQDIKELNYAYLYCIRENARRDVPETALRFGLDQGLVQALANCSVERLREIANPSILQFKLRGPSHVRSLLREEHSEVTSLLNAISLLGECGHHE